MRRIFSLLTTVVVVAAAATTARGLVFESGPVRPLALSSDGRRLFAVNIPDARLEIFDVTSSRLGLEHVASVPVGLEPVAVAARNDHEVWVVNHLSDSVSIVDVSASPPRVRRTLLVGDEPRDIVFAGPDGNRAFITTAHRGQHRSHASIAAAPGAGDPRLTTEGVGRADVWVFDAASPGTSVGGTPLEIVVLFGDTPRALAVSHDGNTVYAAVFHSGNRTTTVAEGVVCDGFDPATSCVIHGVTYPGGNPGPATNQAGDPAPEVGLVVKYNPASGHWQDELGRDWDAAVRFDLPDKDVFAIDANTLDETGFFTGVGTTLFNMAVNPVSGHVYVSNTEARNEVRFEGPGRFGESTVQGRLHESRITVLAGASVNPRHLNKHIDYDIRPAEAGTRDHSLATPLDMAVSSDGATLYVTAFGSSKVGVFSIPSLEADVFDPSLDSAGYVSVKGGGPCGLALDEEAQRLFVLTRFDNAIAVVDLVTRAEVGRVPLLSPEPLHVVKGRPFLYDAFESSSNGEASCAGCHVFGDTDHLAWDLGNPDEFVTNNPIPIAEADQAAGFPSPVNGTGVVDDFHPMKGPMMTQTLRGLVNSGAMHWRGDRATGFFGTDAFDAELSFDNFITAFVGLMGRDSPIATVDMQAFTDFALEIAMPPNPVRALDHSLTAEQTTGRALFTDPARCGACHPIDAASGFFSTDGRGAYAQISQVMKIPQMRNLYQKVGMFGMPKSAFLQFGDGIETGDQVRGFGFLHDGSIDTLFRFDPIGGPIEQFLLAFDTDLAPIVGQQVTRSSSLGPAVDRRIDLMLRRADVPYPSQILGAGATECDLVVHGVLGGEARGWLHAGAGLFQSDRAAEPLLGDAQLRALADAEGQELTYTCAPFGSGLQMALDRDRDGVRNRDEIDAQTDPANPGSLPGACSDGLDNDGDGHVDLDDPACLEAHWNSENPACDDGLDNDGDGHVDAFGGGGGLADPQCRRRPWRSTESRACGLGFELALAIPALVGLRSSRRRR